MQRQHPPQLGAVTPRRSTDPVADRQAQRSRYARVVTKASRWPVQETVTRLSAVIAARGLKHFTTIDHSAEAEARGLQLRDTKLVIFGNPQTGTPVMNAAPLAALDLPMKVLVWADGPQTKVSYTAPAELAARYGLSDELAAGLEAINAVTDEVIGQPDADERGRQDNSRDLRR